MLHYVTALRKGLILDSLYSLTNIINNVCWKDFSEGFLLITFFCDKWSITLHSSSHCIFYLRHPAHLAILKLTEIMWTITFEITLYYHQDHHLWCWYLSSAEIPIRFIYIFRKNEHIKLCISWFVLIIEVVFKIVFV